MNKKGMVMTIIGVVMGITALNFCTTVYATSDKTVVYEMYTFECERCNYPLAEGEYSHIDKQGVEQCKECGFYRELGYRKR